MFPAEPESKQTAPAEGWNTTLNPHMMKVLDPGLHEVEKTPPDAGPAARTLRGVGSRKQGAMAP